MTKNQTTVTFYGGVNEIGGNKILIQDKDTKIFFDFGMSFTAKKQFYSPPFLSPKNEKSLQELGILPKIDASTRLTQLRHRQTPFSSLTGTWTIQLTCRLLNVKFQSTAERQHSQY